MPPVTRLDASKIGSIHFFYFGCVFLFRDMGGAGARMRSKKAKAHAPIKKTVSGKKMTSRETLALRSTIRKMVDALMSSRGEFPIESEPVYLMGRNIADCPGHAAEEMQRLVACIDAALHCAGARLETVMDTYAHDGERVEEERGCKVVWG